MRENVCVKAGTRHLTHLIVHSGKAAAKTKMYISSGHQKHSMFTCSRHHLSHTDFTTAATLRTNVNTYLVNESTQSGEHVSEGSFWLADFEESQVDVKHLLHQCVVTVAVQQLVLNHTYTHKNRCTKYQCKLYSSISYITVDVWADLWAERCWWRFRRISFCSHRLKANEMTTTDGSGWFLLCPINFGTLQFGIQCQYQYSCSHQMKPLIKLLFRKKTHS